MYTIPYIPHCIIQIKPIYYYSIKRYSLHLQPKYFYLTTKNKIYMKKKLLLMPLACCAMYAQAQQMSAEDQKMQHIMMAYAQPGPMHQILANNVGEWTATTTMWMAPNTQPVKNTASATSLMIMNGLYEQSTHTANFMGMPFSGISTTGYDNARKVFVNTWIDNMGSGVMYSEGKYNEAKKCIEFKGKMTCPVACKAVDFSQTLTFIDADHQKLEMWAPSSTTGQTFKTMEVLSTRKKS